MKKAIAAVILLSVILTMLLCGCHGADDAMFSIALPEKQIQNFNLDEIYTALVSKIKPDNDELYVGNWNGVCSLEPDGQIYICSNNIYAQKGDDVYCYLVLINQGKEIKVQKLSKEKYSDSIFTAPGSVLKLHDILNGMKRLPWDSVFHEYKIDDLVDYEVSDGRYLGFTSKAIRYFMLSDNACEEIDAPPQQSEQYCNIVISPYYGTREAAAPNNLLSFYYVAE